MGQKIHPIGLRLGITRTWSSRWFATKDYPKLLKEDSKIRAFIKKKLFNAGISRTDIERKAAQVEVTIFSAKPGVVVGRGGQGIDALRRDLSALIGKKVQINIQEVQRVEADAQLVAENIAAQLEKRIAF
ncbi:MAG TPA: 30S ribosomal protein S3, partial [Chroococcales cyanobacterium]